MPQQAFTDTPNPCGTLAGMEKPDNDATEVDARITLPPDTPWPMQRDFLIALGMDVAPDASGPPDGTLSTSVSVTGVPTAAAQHWFDELRGILPELVLEWFPAGTLRDDSDPDDEEFDEDTMATWGQGEDGRLLNADLPTDE